eukprot:Protomagalhaensia_sp_Gyna_25__3246@NODE_2952_length_804_cov_291_594771_g2467_i0_p1_GENE_NODE_2952_length_804_cov_291_594771_g2467_i0NODE_2952_length_804_cov_291_594771_g2467_i0_p1_ORF_typecomplete_len181_score17_41Acetyltransf_10/PF13673_7/2e09Acetyltransf_1/PF00583_25/5e09Acetyltransf_7/PF13508_7/8_4e06Acetyltransf_4/PF13420_7/3_6e05Acetyltransf_3/PF13302_7/0_00014FR47/PF08445_10/0_075_NODE_2952_length_804_cov_291_594771_g2467_i031573
MGNKMPVETSVEHIPHAVVDPRKGQTGYTLPTHDIELQDGKYLHCRPMTLSDYEEVRAIIPQVTRCHKVMRSGEVASMLSCGNFFPYVVCCEDVIIGYAELHRLPHFGRGFDCRLEKVLITEPFRGQKVAQRFCGFLCDLARDELECGRVDLTVEKPDAKALYTHLGFSRVDTEVWRLLF